MTDIDVRVHTMLEEAGLPVGGSEELVSFLACVEGRYVDDASPEPGPGVAALLGGLDARGAGGSTRRSRGGRAASVGVVAVSVVAFTGWAAAANELPAPAQRWVAELSQRYLPFDLPYPDPTLDEGSNPFSRTRSRQLEAHDARPTPHDRPAGTSGGGGLPGQRLRDVDGNRSDPDDRDITEVDRDGDEEAGSGVGDAPEERSREPRTDTEAESDDRSPASATERSGESDTESFDSDDGWDGDGGYDGAAREEAEDEVED